MATGLGSQPITLNRYCEFREADGKIKGIAVKYSDRYIFGESAYQFVAGCFGAVDAVDAVCNVQHNRDRPIARTGGGGLQFKDDDEALRVELELPATTLASDTRELIKSKVFRGFSLEVLLNDYDYDTGYISDAEITGLAVVDRPAFKQSVITDYRHPETLPNLRLCLA